ncbi:Receptor-like protein kinase precursor [Actinidia chinensis var. chinensis]|uniref:Receptor-like protein kinase n=1 Tax=Actinidia chinensis var. chinensis TaxID=1590841 RepID=A0A2R6RCN5_ACTCC|nr:Receptor-like protein kinase precursor [Actinidia chinensis var. chinensis]
METLRTRTRSFLSLFISLSLLHLSLASAFSPTDHYLIDCGSADLTTVDADHRRFTGDSSEFGSRFLLSTRTIRLGDSNPSPDSSPIYHTARVFTRPSKYAFRIRDRGTHLVRLHFHRFDSSNFDFYDSQFHVLANGYVLLNNFTVVDTQNPRIKDYMIWVDSEELVITFMPSKKSKFAFVNAIEVISAPKDLVADVATLVNYEKIERINGLMKSALETVYRVNVGGPKLTPFNDSLWRNWVPDDEFLKSSDGSGRVYYSGRIKYQMGGASREVGPDNVYNSARLIASLNDSVPKLNLSWEFPVMEGYKYLVRLHFCDIASISLGLLYFNVYVNGKLAYENLDLSSITNLKLASPFYADFVVDEQGSGVLSVSVGPSNMSMSHTVDAILNGVEIMKVNNSMGILDGEVCAGAILKSWPRSHVGALVPLIGAVCLLVIASFVLHRRLVGAKNSAAWSLIPVDISEINLKSGIQTSLGKV